MGAETLEETLREVRTRNAAKARKVFLKDAVPVEEIRQELEEFRSKWNLRAIDLPTVVGVNPGTVHNIFFSGNKHVLADTASAVRKGIRNYNHRTCRYRRIPKSEARKLLRQIKDRLNMNWPDVAEVIDYPISRIWQLNSDKTNVQLVDIDTVRDWLINYNKWVLERERKLA